MFTLDSMPWTLFGEEKFEFRLTPGLIGLSFISLFLIQIRYNMSRDRVTIDGFWIGKGIY
jgi:hypothetical protein